MSAIRPLKAPVRMQALLAACVAELGTDYVLASQAECDRWARTTFVSGTRPSVIVRPGSTAQVQAMVRLAASYQVPVHPVSRGRNWGYGDACAPQDGCMLLDLSRLDRIRTVDRELGYAVLEPGVTQGQLADRLTELGGEWTADCTGAGPDSSMIGNLADRGFGHSPYGDRFAHACAFEVVLADGSVIETGFAGLPGSKAANVYKWGIGPAIDGLFTQSNLGIITRATIWLMPRPRTRAMLLIRSDDPQAILVMTEALRELRLEGVLSSTVHIFNRMRLLGAVIPFPYDRADGTRALDDAHPELVAELARTNRLPAWIATAALTGPPALVRAAIHETKARLRARGFNGSVLSFGSKTMAAARLVGRLLPTWAGGEKLRAQVAKLELMWRLLAGRPDAGSLTGGSWRARRSVPGSTDPRDGGAGMIWLSPVLPATGRAVAEVEMIARQAMHAYGFEHQVTYSFVNPRALCGVISICFDREDLSQRARAGKCHDRLLAALAEAGYCPYRGAPATLRQLWTRPAAPWALLRRLKEALDPTDILSPGRYIPDQAAKHPDAA